MNSNMYSNSIVQENMEKLRRHGFTMVEPGEGDLACGWTGRGRLAETDVIALEVQKAVTPQDYKGESILVSAGATREHIDPVRFISNPSTGKMGYSIARAGWLRGARATLVSGYSSLPDPHGVEVVRVTDCAMICTSESTSASDGISYSDKIGGSKRLLALREIGTEDKEI